MAGLRLGVIASGRGTDLQSLLDARLQGRIASQVVLVLSDNAEAKALDRARQAGVAAEHVPVPSSASGPQRREEHNASLAKRLDQYGVELVVLAGYMRILGPSFVQKYRGRVLNIHPALLPSFPGVHAQKQALEAGVRVTGCTVHFVDEKVDHGPILLQAAVPVLADDDEDSLSRRILAVEHQLLPRAVNLVEQGRAHWDGTRVRLEPDESWTTRYPTVPGVLYGNGY